MTDRRERRVPRDMRGSARMAPLLFAMAVVPSGLGAWGCYQGWRTLEWPTTGATILQSDARQVHSERRQDGQTVTDTRHTVSIRYSYAANGREYLGEGIQPFSYGMQNSAAARDQAERYRPGTAARVAYNPDNPAEAYLEPGPSSVSMMLLAVGAILTAAGFWIRSIASRAARRARGQKP